MSHWVAVGSDGTRLVIWGMGDTKAAAIRDARRWLAECDPRGTADLDLHRITDEQYQAIEAGDVQWPPEARSPEAVRS